VEVHRKSVKYRCCQKKRKKGKEKGGWKRRGDVKQTLTCRTKLEEGPVAFFRMGSIQALMLRK